MPAETIAILGAGGFVGHWLHREVVARGASVWPSHPTDKIDILDVDTLRRLISELRPRAIVNLAAIASPAIAKRQPRSAWDVNFQGTMNVANAIMELSPQTRLIFIGSAEEYGETFSVGTAPLTEGALLAPTSTYGASKAAADLLVGQMAHQGLNVVRFRPFNHTGPGQAPIYVVAAFARQVARILAGMQPSVIEVGNLDAVRDFLDVRDIVRAYVDAALADSSVARGRVFNLASGRGLRIGDILDLLIAKAGIAPEIIRAPGQVGAAEVPRVGAAGAIAEALGWSPAIAFDQTLNDVLADWSQRIRNEAP